MPPCSVRDELSTLCTAGSSRVLPLSAVLLLATHGMHLCHLAHHSCTFNSNPTAYSYTESEACLGASCQGSQGYRDGRCCGCGCSQRAGLGVPRSGIPSDGGHLVGAQVVACEDPRGWVRWRQCFRAAGRRVMCTMTIRPSRACSVGYRLFFMDCAYCQTHGAGRNL